jgi:hydrogenase maturation protein HypF
MCDAANDEAVRCLRARKRRPAKPLAVMFPRSGCDQLARLRVHCAPDAAEARSLASSDRPIVLVPLRPGGRLSSALAPGLSELGAFLPYSPLHELLVGGFDGPLVATSGNVDGEPVVTSPEEAERLLASIADAFLHHDRPILRPADDGVVRVIAGRTRPLRLGRGSAPLRHRLPRALAAPVLALGGHMKVTLTLGFDDCAVISPHLGDLDSPRALDLLEATAETLQRLHGVRTATLICDAHPNAAGARWARRQGMRVVEIAHHHAHAAAVAGEFPHELRWLCFAWDGVGLGPDGTLWGGEALLGRPGAWSRFATFRPFTPPGGDRAAREPWRSAAALAWELGLDWTPPDIDARLARGAWAKRVNAPATSSVGRLFDAAASFLDLAQRASHEGEGPMVVEAAAGPASDDAAALPLARRADGVWQADWAPLVAMLRDEARPCALRAAAFHDSLAQTLVAQATAARLAHGDFAVGLCGGVFQNRRLAEAALAGLESAGFRAYLPLAIPCNDAGLSFGQVVEAAARL